VPAHVQPTTAGFRLELAQPVYGVAAGQAAVLYEDGVVVAAGIIEADP
jgi:tRNA U34 2-thiouridine synthase MnmA/TrmU